MTVMNRSSLDYYQDTRVDLATILRVLFDHKGLIIAIVSLFFVVGLAYAILATPIYQADAMIQIEPKKGSRALPKSITSRCRCHRRQPKSS
jgi:tyrosine-protein kinase Etk/Wzc